MRLTAGGVRELHWHTADEMGDPALPGSARITAIDKDGKSFVADVKKKTICGISPAGFRIPNPGPWIRTARNSCWYSTMGIFSESETVLLSDSMAHLPRDSTGKELRGCRTGF